jgi:predicted nucleic acid-binding protein
MRAFLDTNVILEFFLDREAGKTACQLFAKLQEQKHSLYMTVGSFYTMIFLVDKYLKRERGLQGDVRLQVLRELMSDILRVIIKKKQTKAPPDQCQAMPLNSVARDGDYIFRPVP